MPHIHTPRAGLPIKIKSSKAPRQDSLDRVGKRGARRVMTKTEDPG